MITKQEAKDIAQAINGALGLALDKMVKGIPDPQTRVTSANGADHPGKALGEVVPLSKMTPPVTGPGSPYGSVFDRVEFEELYQKIKRRLIDECRVDPILLSLLTTSNAIEVQVEPRIETLTGTTLRTRVARLMAAGYFKETKRTGTVRTELGRTGADPGGGGQLAGILADFVRDGFLQRDGEGFQIAPGVQVTEKVIEAR